MFYLFYLINLLQSNNGLLSTESEWLFYIYKIFNKYKYINALFYKIYFIKHISFYIKYIIILLNIKIYIL